MGQNLLSAIDIIKAARNNSKKFEEQIKTEESANTMKTKTFQKEAPVTENLERPDRLNKDFIVQCLLEYHKEDAEKKRNRKKEKLSITEDLVNCVRKSFYAFENYPVNETFIYPYTEPIVRTGDAVHDVLQKRIPNLECEESFRVQIRDYTISGRLDMMYNDHTIVELKTIGTLPSSPKPEHSKQVLIYSFICNEYLNKKITLAQLLYFSRGKADVAVFDCDVNDQIVEQVKKYVFGFVDELDKYRKLKTPPPINSPFVNKESCIFCAYKDVCSGKTKFESIGG